MKKILTVALLGACLLAGCGADSADSAEQKVKQEESVEASQNVAISKVNQMDEAEQVGEGNQMDEAMQTDEAVEVEKEVNEVFASLPDEFVYSSGAGAWATDLYLNDDGTFSGAYHDSDMGAVGEDYPNGTMYISDFTGKFTEPQQVNEYIYSTSIEYIKLEKEEGQEYIEDGIRYVVVGASELSDSEEILIYMPGTPYAEMDANFMSWLVMGDLGPEDLRCYGIYNAKSNAVFVGYNYAELSELYKLDGQFQSENGDVLILSMYMDEEVVDNEIGTCEWKPHDDEPLTGHVHRNVEGGITIYLPESRSHSFGILDSESGTLAGVGYTAEYGVFQRM